MPNRKKVERSANYSYYSDLLWCTVPLIGMSWYYYGARPVLLLLAALLTAYLCDCALAPLHGTGYQSHEPSSECFAALIVLLMPVVQLLLFGFAISVEVNNIDFAVVASHPTEAVRRQVERIAANPYFTFGGYIRQDEADEVLSYIIAELSTDPKFYRQFAVFAD